MKASNGPTNWGKTCSHGRRQSPINVIPAPFEPAFNLSVPAIDTRTSVLKYKPKSNNFAFHCVPSFGPCGVLHHDSVEYSLVQVHLHSPSEHLLASRRYPLEMHFVHTAPNDNDDDDESDRIAVVAVFFVVGQSNQQLQVLLDGAMAESYVVAPLDLLQVASDSDVCVTDGSLTTPPCNEDVTWVFGLRVLEASLAQIGRFREMVGEMPNARPLQPLNGRNLRCYPRIPIDGGIPSVVRRSTDVEFMV